MSHVPSQQLMEEVGLAAKKKAALSPRAMVLTGFLSGALLAYATAFAFKSSDGLTPGVASLVSGAVFPVGFAMIVLLGLELATGNFAVLPVGVARGQVTYSAMFRNWAWVYLGNFLGSVAVGGFLALTLTEAFTHDPGALGGRIQAVALAKTHMYAHAGAAGWCTALVKGVLCNWMVALGTILGLSSTSTSGKVAAIWLPISTFFALALEHSVVNMFVIPTAIVLGANISLGEWLLWNQLPVTLGNVIGGAVFTGLLLHHGLASVPAVVPRAASLAKAD